MNNKTQKSDADWQQQLSPEEYQVCRKKGTERAFTGKYYDHHDDGVYTCVCCGADLFDSNAKYESGSGWPSFYQPKIAEHVGENMDHSHGMTRTEVVCNQCNAHLGHVFTDGPQPTGLRYCINSVSLNFKPREE